MAKTYAYAQQNIFSCDFFTFAVDMSFFQCYNRSDEIST